MTKKKIILIVIGAFLTELLLAAIGTSIFLHFGDSGNVPMDFVGPAYIRENQEFIDEYGEIDVIARNTENGIIEEEYAKIQFFVYNDSNQEIIVWLEFEKVGENWNVTSMKVTEIGEVNER